MRRFLTLLSALVLTAGCEFLNDPYVKRGPKKPRTKKVKPAPKKDEPPSENDIEETKLHARAIMQRFADGHFPAEQTSNPNTGWVMVQGGRQLYQSFLNEQASLLIPLGPHAVPELIYFLEHESMPVRYIAYYSLAHISKLDSDFPIFAKLDALKRGGHIKKTKARYRDWYDQRSP